MVEGMKKTVKESALYIAIGAIASSIDGLFYVFFTRALQFWFLAANFLSVNIGVTVSFFLNAHVNFKKTQRLFRRAVSFYGVCYFGMLVSMAILYVGTSVLGFPDIPIKVFAVIAAGTVQFVFNKRVTFGRIK
ncbi:MAG TPA: GtrA family protein [Treponemataceae bacterium]|nr:GtrA family protein [Treponemataceae bacterium]